MGPCDPLLPSVFVSSVIPLWNWTPVQTGGHNCRGNRTTEGAWSCGVASSHGDTCENKTGSKMLMGLPDKSGEVVHSSERRENNWTCEMLVEMRRSSQHSHIRWGHLVTIGSLWVIVRRSNYANYWALVFLLHWFFIFSNGARWLIRYYRKN